jgi:hypothetical protein
MAGNALMGLQILRVRVQKVPAVHGAKYFSTSVRRLLANTVEFALTV